MPPTQAREAEQFVMLFEMLADDDGLDEAPNLMTDLIDAGRLDATEHAAQHILERHPEVTMASKCLAMVAASR